ncbi:MAG: acyl carrier protein [Lentisphaeria bacterium]|jgi:acyl carrier protein|nr:acyl carrier protein [Lentisphaeria bacterium]
MSEIAQKVKELVVKQLAVQEDQVTEDARFVEDLNADSLDIVEMIMALEEEFGSEIPDEEAENLKTVGDAIKYIESKAAAKE